MYLGQDSDQDHFSLRVHWIRLSTCPQPCRCPVPARRAPRSVRSSNVSMVGNSSPTRMIRGAVLMRRPVARGRRAYSQCRQRRVWLATSAEKCQVDSWPGLAGNGVLHAYEDESDPIVVTAFIDGSDTPYGWASRAFEDHRDVVED